MLQLKALDEIDFPNFPLSITEDKAKEVAEKISDEWWGAEVQETVAWALQGMFSFLLRHQSVHVFK